MEAPKFRFGVQLQYGQSLQGLFDDEEKAMDALNRFGEALAQVREFGNDTKSVIFRVRPIGVVIDVDLRKALSAYVEEVDTQHRAFAAYSLRLYSLRKETLDEAKKMGVLDELERAEKQSAGFDLPERPR